MRIDKSTAKFNSFECVTQPQRASQTKLILQLIISCYCSVWLPVTIELSRVVLTVSLCTRTSHATLIKCILCVRQCGNPKVHSLRAIFLFLFYRRCFVRFAARNECASTGNQTCECTRFHFPIRFR